MGITSLHSFSTFYQTRTLLTSKFMIEHMYYRNDLLFKEVLTKISEEGISYCKNIVRSYSLKISEYFINFDNKILILFNTFYFQKICSIKYIINEHKYSKYFLKKSTLKEFSFNLKDILNCLSLYLFGNLITDEYPSCKIKDEFIYKPKEKDSSKKRYVSVSDQFDGDILNVIDLKNNRYKKLFRQFEGDVINKIPIN